MPVKGTIVSGILVNIEIGSDSLPDRHQAPTRTNVDIFLIERIGTDLSEIWIILHQFSLKKKNQISGNAETITWNSVDQDLRRYMASLGHIELIYNTSHESYIRSGFLCFLEFRYRPRCYSWFIVFLRWHRGNLYDSPSVGEKTLNDIGQWIVEIIKRWYHNKAEQSKTAGIFYEMYCFYNMCRIYSASIMYYSTLGLI